eukprot:143352-Chlamydomonas_euryale.AAC.4
MQSGIGSAMLPGSPSLTLVHHLQTLGSCIPRRRPPVLALAAVLLRRRGPPSARGKSRSGRPARRPPRGVGWLARALPHLAIWQTAPVHALYRARQAMLAAPTPVRPSTMALRSAPAPAKASTRVPLPHGASGRFAGRLGAARMRAAPVAAAAAAVAGAPPPRARGDDNSRSSAYRPRRPATLARRGASLGLSVRVGRTVPPPPPSRQPTMDMDAQEGDALRRAVTGALGAVLVRLPRDEGRSSAPARCCACLARLASDPLSRLSHGIWRDLPRPNKSMTAFLRLQRATVECNGGGACAGAG